MREYLEYAINQLGFACSRSRDVVRDKATRFRTDMHYSDPDANREVTVFGEPLPGLFYNYSDRLYCTKWVKGCELAEKQAEPGTARYYEIALNYFHDSSDVDLQHVTLGCNRMSGFSYLIFGYTYTSSEEGQPEETEDADTDDEQSATED
jgi:hypothetical protein